MEQEVRLKKYDKKIEHSYSFGAFPTIELLKARPEQVKKVLLHENFERGAQSEQLFSLCQRHGIPIEENNRTLERIRDKENCYVVGVFQKYRCQLEQGENHIVLVHPGDMGNIGTILRTSLGFHHTQVALIEPCGDIFHPKVIRASMGSLFQISFQSFESFEAYQNQFSQRELFPFMLKGAVELTEIQRNSGIPYSLIFGNEASGLKDSYAELGKSVYIRHSKQIDSLNLAIAVGIGLFHFSGTSQKTEEDLIDR